MLSQAWRETLCTKQTQGWFTVTDEFCAFISSGVSADLQHDDITVVEKA